MLGPFTDGTALKTTLKLLRRIFPYCTCKKPHNNYCLNYHIENCLGFCCLKNESRITNYELGGYKKNVRAIQDVLSGKKVLLLKKLENEMKQAAKNDEFIKAIGLRNKLGKLRWIFENAKILKELQTKDKTLKKMQVIFGLSVLPQRIEAYDISNIQGTNAVGAMAVFIDGQPDKNQYRKFKIKTILKADDVAMLKEVISRRFAHKDWPMPDLILVDGGKAQLNATHSVIFNESSSPDFQIRIIALSKNKKHKPEKIHIQFKGSPWTIKELPKDIQNLLTQIDSEVHHFAVDYHRKTHRKTAFDPTRSSLAKVSDGDSRL